MGRAKITEIPPLPTPAKNFVFVLYLNVEQELFSKNMRDQTFIPIHGHLGNLKNTHVSNQTSELLCMDVPTIIRSQNMMASEYFTMLFIFA